MVNKKTVVIMMTVFFNYIRKDDYMHQSIASYANITAYIRDCQNVISETKAQHNPNIKDPYWNLAHIYSISDKLIETVGRYCQTNQSDFLLTYNSFLNTLKEKSIDEHFFVFGIRKLGVDGIGYLEIRINDDSRILTNDFYRAIYAIQISEINSEFTNEPELKIELKDISNMSINSLQ